MLEATLFEDPKYYTNIKEEINPQVEPTHIPNFIHAIPSVFVFT